MSILNLENIQIIIAFLSVGVALVQTVRLRNVKKIRDTYLRLIWLNLKTLSSDLLLQEEHNVSRRACGSRSQRIEELIATLIVNTNNINRQTVDKWKADGEIDDYDYEVLKRLTLQI